MTLRVLESYDLGVIIRTPETEALLLVGSAARTSLRHSHTSIIVKRPDTPIALLGLPMDVAPPLTLERDVLFPAVGRDWYLVDESAARDAYGLGGPIIGTPSDEATLWVPERGVAVRGHEGGRVAAIYYEEPE